MSERKMHMSGENSSIDGERSETAGRGHVNFVILDEFVEQYPGGPRVPQAKEQKHALIAQIGQDFDTLNKLREEL